jgi:hypothetical protein
LNLHLIAQKGNESQARKCVSPAALFRTTPGAATTSLACGPLPLAETSLTGALGAAFKIGNT